MCALKKKKKKTLSIHFKKIKKLKKLIKKSLSSMATILNLQPNSAVLHKMSDEEKRHALPSYHKFKEFTNISTQHLFKCNYLFARIVFYSVVVCSLFLCRHKGETLTRL